MNSCFPIWMKAEPLQRWARGIHVGSTKLVYGVTMCGRWGVFDTGLGSVASWREHCALKRAASTTLNFTAAMLAGVVEAPVYRTVQAAARVYRHLERRGVDLEFAFGSNSTRTPLLVLSRAGRGVFHARHFKDATCSECHVAWDAALELNFVRLGELDGQPQLNDRRWRRLNFEADPKWWVGRRFVGPAAGWHPQPTVEF